ncbi:SGNH hydrolase-type esterase domain-containing protein [Tanacetum coccineum]
MTLIAQNPNRVGIRYDFSRLKILDDGLIVGMIRIPGFYQPARSHNVSVEIDSFFECLDISKVMSGVKTNNFTIKVAGDIGVHLRLLQIKLPKIKMKSIAYEQSATTVHILMLIRRLLQEMLNRFLLKLRVLFSGDSLLSRPGINNKTTLTPSPVLQANYLPYGESYFSPPTGRFSDGRLISDFIGAGALIETLPGLVVDLQTQLQYFSDVENHYRQSLGDSKAEQLLSNAVYLFSCGANDYISHVPSSFSMANIYPTLTNEQYTELVIGNLTSVIKGIYKKGGRKFGFLTVPLIGCFPALRIGQPGNACNQEMNDIVTLHNQKLATKLKHLEKQLDGFMYSIFDISTAITNRMNNPSKYGFNEGETACCGSGPLRVSLHPMNWQSSQFAKMFWKGDPMVTGPYNLKALFDGCLSSQQAALFVFGDSLFDPGNNHHINTTADFQANFWPYGQSYFSPPTGRFSDGRLIPDFIGGAGALINSHAGFVVDLQTQLRYFGDLVNHYRQNLGDTKSRQLLSDAGIYEKGGRKFGVVTAPLIGCWPGIQIRQPGNTCNTEIDELTRLHNQALAKRLEHLEIQLEGFICGGMRGIKEYLYFNSFHPNELASRQFAEMFWDGDSMGSRQQTSSQMMSYNHALAMANASSKSRRFAAVVIIMCLPIPTKCHTNIHKQVLVFVFGDSLFNPGNNNYINTTTAFQANFTPYGESYFYPPTGRFSNGRFMPDFIAEYAGLPLIPAYLEPGNNEFTYGANFASAGAGALIETLAGFFVAEPGEALVSVYNRFAQLMNDLERNDMHFSIFEKLVNVSRAKKLEKSHDPLALVAHTGSSSRNTSSYYVTHPTSVVDYEDEYQQDDVHTNSEDPLTSAMLLLARAITQNFSTPINNRLRASSNTRNQTIIQGDRVNIQSRKLCNVRRIIETIQLFNPKTAKWKRTLSRNFPKQDVRDSKLLHGNKCCCTIGDDQIDSDIIFDSPNRNVNSGSIEKDTHVLDICNSEISLNVRDTEDTLDDASKSKKKVYEKMNDPIAVANKQNCWTIDYAQINALYKDFVPQKELSVEQKYFPSSFIPSDKNSNATPSIPVSMPSESPLIIDGKGHYARNCPKPRVRDSKYFMEQMLLAKQDEAGVILTDEQNDFLFADASRMEEIEELSANICLMARIQPADNTSDAGPSYDSAFISEVQSSSNNENEEQMYPTHTKIINSTIGDDQIDSDIIFDSPNRNVNSGSIEKDTHVPDLCALEQLARNAYQEAEKQQIFAQKVQKQNMTLTSQLELYKERVRILENINGDNNYLNEFLEADKRAKHFSQQAQSQFVRDRDIIRDLEKQRDKLELDVKDYKRQNEEL